MRVAVVGAGLSGLAAAHELARSGEARVTVYEKEDHLGGNGSNTMAVEDGAGGRVHVDLGSMMTSPNMTKWFEELGVEVETSNTSFSASLHLDKGGGFEWGTRNGISGVLVQKSNLLSPRFWLVIRDIFKFKNHALEYLEDHGRNPDWNETLGQFIQKHRYSQLFQDAYLLFGRPQWHTVKGGSGSYVDKVRGELESMGCQIKTGCEVKSVSKFNEGISNYKSFLSSDPQFLSYDVYFHCDESLMPRNFYAWSARNFLGTSRGVCVTHWLNILQVPNYMLEEGGTAFSFGRASEKCNLKSVIQVHDPQFYWKINLYNRLERKRLLRISARKSNYIRKGWWSGNFLGITGVAFAKYILRNASRKNSLSKVVKNISKHYDLNNDFFALYLDPSMTYSSGIFKAEDESLEAAQLRKLDSLISKAKVESWHHVLDIGSGCGTLAIRLVKKTGCKYTGITLSEEQLKYSKQKVKEAGLEDLITLLLCDYRQIPTCQKFDRIISCEMIEHVGHEYMDEFFGCCEYHLAEHGLFVLQFITIPEEMYDKMRLRPEFLKEYIFPGGCLPSLSRVVSAMTKASSLCVQHLENIGDHYYPTLMHWRDNFLANRKKVSALGFDETFIRTWEYYLTYCAATFKSRTIMDYQMVFARPGDAKLPSYLAIE
nr:unnamed protein product [Digitaria exilis]